VQVRQAVLHQLRTLGEMHQLRELREVDDPGSGGAVLTVRRLPAIGLTATVILLAALWVTLGLSPAGWVVGLLCGVVVNTVVGVALVRAGSPGPGPADLVTLGRAVITCALAALTADALAHERVTPWFAPLTVVALALDAVDGRVARRTGTTSSFGGRFDGEVDAFLILVLSVYVAADFGAWTMAGGLVRYVFGLAVWVLPWMRAHLMYRHWRKVVAAIQGIVLAVAAADVVPRWFAMAGLVLGLALLAESFGRDVGWLWRHRVTARHPRATLGATPAVAPGPRADRV
jgi:phosphatidylglycerophosphate synthase